ncbi:MAG: hypothetical protein E7426_02945 [Ruminococcaceae bacterium]|nr:hypothetical protein [Oscillospiraceae bacterium]
MEENYSQVSLEERVSDQQPAEQTPKKGRKTALLVCGIVAGVLAAGYAAICGVAASSDTVLKGTSVLGVDVGGLTRQQIEELWQQEGPRLSNEMGISLMKDDEEVSRVSLSDLTVTVTPEDAANSAWEATHSSFLADGWNYIRSWFTTNDVSAPLSADEASLNEALDRISAGMASTVVDGAYRLDEEKSDGLYVTKPRDGVEVDSKLLREAIANAVATGDLSPIQCTYIPVSAQPIDLAALYEEIHGEMANAGYDKATGDLTDSRIGVEFDVAEAQALLAKAEPGEEIVIPGTVAFPVVEKDELENVLFRDCLGTYTTYVSGSSNRLNNVRRAAGVVNGYILNSGERFSYNRTIGNPNKENGYLTAPGYVGGKTVDVYGGGVCQVSSTLYYATLLSNLKIVERWCHQYAPGYITWGCDATTFYPSPDYVFENNTDYPIKIVTEYSSNNNLTVSIYGTKLDDTYVRMVSSTLSTTPSKVEYKEDDSLKPGQKVLEQSGYTGYFVKTWRNVYAGDGTLISSEVEATSDYEMRPTIYRIGPEKEEPKPEKEDTKPGEEPTEPEKPTEPETPETPAPEEPTEPAVPETPETPETPTPETPEEPAPETPEPPADPDPAEGGE